MLATHSIRLFSLHFPSRASPCAITFQLDSNAGYTMFRGTAQEYWLPTPFACFPFTSLLVRYRVPSRFNWTLLGLRISHQYHTAAQTISYCCTDNIILLHRQYHTAAQTTARCVPFSLDSSCCTWHRATRHCVTARVAHVEGRSYQHFTGTYCFYKARHVAIG